MLKKIGTTKTKSEQAYQAIKDSIIKNELLPGMEISIGSLADSLGISHTPVREAVARLNADGLVNYEAHKKLSVSKITEEDVSQIYELRRLLEPYAASRVIAALPNDLKLEQRLQKILEKATQILQSDIEHINYRDYLEIDNELDKAFIRSAGKTLLREVLTLVGERSVRIRTFAEAVSNNKQSEMMRLVTEEHLSIIQALLEENTEITKVRVLEHLKNGEARTLNAIRNKLGF